MAEKAKMQDEFDLHEILRLQKALQELTHSIHAAPNNKEIIGLKHRILKFFNVESADIYLLDRIKSELYTLTDKMKEKRLTIDDNSIPGHVAAGLKFIHLNINNGKVLSETEGSLMAGMDKIGGAVVREVMAAPIVFEDKLMGVLQLNNTKRDSEFRDVDPVLMQDIVEALGISLNNQEKLTSRRRKTKFDYLLDNNLLKEDELNNAIEHSRKQKESLEAVLMREYKISKDNIAKAYEIFYGCRCVLFDQRLPIPGDLIKNLKKEYLRRELWVPIAKVGQNIQVILDNPQNILKLDTIQSILKTKAIQYDVAFEEDILKYINYFFSGDSADSSIEDILGKVELDREVEDDSAEEIQESDNLIIQLVNKIINGAIQANASDIHIEPNVADRNVEVRYRVDGDCSLVQTLPFSYRAAIVSRIKVIANLDITHKRLPQDGKIRFKRPDGSAIELRVATIPTQGGVEDVVMRILARGEVMPLDALGLSKRNYGELVKIAEQPYGIVLVVGPTGSGKTTTLHGVLKYINKPNKKIWTAEDPVEITQRGLRQVQMHSKIGLDFAASMRSFLRADPDVIMVGEMRDFETAKIGVEASLTGHLVFSTLHTNNAPETIIRLLDIGIDSFNFADSLLGILAQRLVRSLCEHCKELYRPSTDELNQMAERYGRDQFGNLNLDIRNLKLYRAKGCPDCGGQGYKGRLGIHELLINSDEIKRLIQKHDTVEAIRKTAMAQGMTTLLQDGIMKTLQGKTDLAQVLRTCAR
jgi:type II secretory ATPase GspE/PulE/Tfp pilus assembly ATPase PilB-like protein